MKQFVYIFILLSFFGFKNTNAKIEPAFSAQHFSELNRYENNLKEKSPPTYLNSKDSKTSIKLHPTKRKKRPKGLVTVHYFIPDEHTFLVPLTGKRLIFSSHSFYFLCDFSCNEKRGPPVVLVS